MADNPDDAGARDFGAAVDGAPVEGCPVEALGYLGSVYYYLTPSGHFLEMRARDHQEPGIDSLFEGESRWLENVYPRKRDDTVVGYHTGRARRYLFRQCTLRGAFDIENDLCGPGVWQSPSGVVVHAGDQVQVGTGEWRRAGFRIGSRVFPVARQARMKPSRRAATAGDAHDLLEFFARGWNWRAPSEAPRLLVGFILQCYLVGVLPWRSHIWITGDAFTGKTTIFRVVQGMLGNLALYAAEPTAAGVRLTLNGAAAPVIIDEIEPDPVTNRARDVVQLARLASSDAQARILRGAPDQTSSGRQVRAAFYFSSILHPAFLPQDASRISVLDLAALGAMNSEGTPPMTEQQLAAGIEKFTRLGPALYARAIDAWRSGRLQANLTAFQSALTAARNVRVGQQVGVLLACAEAALQDDEIAPSIAKEMVETMDLVAVADRQPEHDHDQCLNHLLSAPANVIRSGSTPTIGQLVHEATFQHGAAERRQLETCGLRLLGLDMKAWTPASSAQGAGRPVYLAVANQHGGLERIFAGTRWAGGVWAQSLRRCDGASTGGKNNWRFAGALSRAILLDFKTAIDSGGVASDND